MRSVGRDMRIDKVVATALLAVAFAGCVDSPLDAPPGDARIVFTSEFTFAGSPSAGPPIDAVRVQPFFWPEGGAAGEPNREPVGHDDEQFVVDAIVDLGERDSATIDVLVELLSEVDNETIVAWSGYTGPIHVVADRVAEQHEGVQLLRGPIGNAAVQSITVSGPSSMLEGESHSARADVVTTGEEAVVVWSTSDPDVAGVDPVGDSVEVHAVGSGYAWIHAGAGAHVDSFYVFVSDQSAGPPAEVQVYPDSAIVIVGSTRTWQAFAFDANGLPTFATFTWEALDPAIATVSSTGVVTAEAVGRARIVASTGGVSDTAIVNVENLPEGVDLVWQGGTPGQEDDWFTPDNWSPARVPTATDVIYIPDNTFLHLDADAEVGGVMADSLAFFSFEIGANTLTVHGDLRAPYIFADSGGRIVMDGASATLHAYSLPALTVLGNVALIADVGIYQGDLVIDGTGDGASFDVGQRFYAYADGGLRVINATLSIAQNDSTFDSGGIYVEGDALFDAGNSTTSLSGGWLGVGGDFTVTATTCTAFRPSGTVVEMVSDTAVISIGCSSPSGNRFWGLELFQETFIDRVIELASNVYVMDELYLDGGIGTTVVGNGHTLYLNWGYAYTATLDHLFIDVEIQDPTRNMYMDSLTFTNMSGESRPQLRYEHPGNPCRSCYERIQVLFDPASAGPYVVLTDSVFNGDSLVLYNAHNPGDGPARTVLNGEAMLHWANIPDALFYESGYGQSGTQHQPLPDSLVARVVDFDFNPVSGVVVDWTVVAGDGSVSPASTLTGADGLAATQFTMGDTAFASHTVIATSPSLPADTAIYVEFPTPTPPAGVALPPTMSRPALQVRSEPPIQRTRREWPEPPARPVPADRPVRKGESR